MQDDSPIANVAGWQVVPLKQITTKIGSGATPRGGSETYLPVRHNFALIRSQNVYDHRFDKSGLAFISDEQAIGLRNVAIQADDVLLNITGDGITFGRACLAPDDVRPACVNQHVSIVRVDPELADAGFVLAFLTHAEVKSYIESFNSGGSRRAITKGHIEAFKLPLPPLAEQRAIASVLGALDDKIEQNRRTAQALEKLARAIFRAWFVDFEPVKAKAAGATSFPSMPQPIFDALPTHFADSDIGLVPEGWGVIPLSKACTLVSGGTPKRSESSYWGGEIPWYSVKDAPAGGNVWVAETSETITEKGLANSAARLLPKGGTIISARGTVGKIAMVGVPMAFNQSCYGLLPADGQAFGYLYQLMESAVGELQQRTHGSVFDTITRATFDGLMVASPAQTVVSAFTTTADPLFDTMLSLKHESAKLAQMRDYLLPKLLSGKIRIRDAERAAATVA